MTPPERWRQIDQLLERALEREPEERRAFLDEACAGDEELRREVESLLAYENEGQQFLQRPATQVMAGRLAGESPSLVGLHVGPYQILSLLGAGGMGEVYKARDTRLNRAVAIKALPRHLSEGAFVRQRFIQEAKAASALNHPNVITLHDIVTDNGRDFIVMEYVPGKSLDMLIPGRGMRLNDALKLSIQIADALAKAHSAGIVHRDLKPSNVMVTDEGQVKVLDFGLAKLTEVSVSSEATTQTLLSETEEGRIIGTPSYMSPEQAEGKRTDARSDIFSFGSVLYEMTTGRRAFKGDSKMSTLAAIIHKEPEPLSGRIPRDLEKVISRCLRKEIQRRFQHMDDVKIALEELKEESDSGVLEAESQGATRRKLGWPGVLVAVAVAVAALGITGWFWLTRSQPTREQTQLTAVPLTTYRGNELFPSLSPDGAQVAFGWCQEDQKCHIYIKQIGVEPPFQLTNTPMTDVSPAWSPDGRFIAFLRLDEEKKRGAVILIPQRGGSERELASWDLSKMSDFLYPPYLAWTPDSKSLVFPFIEGHQKSHALFLVSVETGAKRWLTKPVETGAESGPAFSPDGRILAFTRRRNDYSDLYLLRLGEGYRPQGEPERVDTGNPVNFTPAWMPEGKELVISSGTLNTTLWRIQVSKAGKPIQLGLPSENAVAPSISRIGKRLVYGVRKYDPNIWRVDLRERGGMPGRPVQLISSTKYERGAAYSTDGKRIAFVSERTGAAEVWSCDSEGRNPVQLTSLGFVALQGLSWSPDDQYIALSGTVEGSQEVYVVSAGGGAPRRLTNQPGTNQWPFWSHDGRWLYFKNSARPGPPQIWKIPPQGGEATQVTRSKEGIDLPQESPDGKFLYFARGWPFTLSIWKIPVEGGEETKVLDSVHAETRTILRKEGIYYIAAPDAKGASDLCLLEFRTGKIRKLLRTPPNMKGDIAISPDGRMVLYSQADEAGNDLMLVENFR